MKYVSSSEYYIRKSFVTCTGHLLLIREWHGGGFVEQ
jgi:hypothetical protein